MRKLRGNGERMRKWRENHFLFISSFSFHFLILCLFPHSLSISSFSLHFLSISSFSLHFLFISSFSLHFLAARLQGCNNLCSPALVCFCCTYSFAKCELKRTSLPQKILRTFTYQPHIWKPILPLGEKEGVAKITTIIFRAPKLPRILTFLCIIF